MLEFEHRYWNDHPGQLLAGIDEVGRGPLAGPVVACAVIIPPAIAEEKYHGDWKALTDSKQLTEAQRELFCAEIISCPGVEFGLGWAPAAEVDQINVLSATYRAMARAVLALPHPPSHALVDGLPVLGLPCESTAIVKGDAKSLLIAAASVVAKVHRDHYMVDLDAQYPGYGFAEHKGYGTATHVHAIRTLGPCPEHRKTFRPVADTFQMSLPL